MSDYGIDMALSHILCHATLNDFDDILSECESVIESYRTMRLEEVEEE